MASIMNETKKEYDIFHLKLTKEYNKITDDITLTNIKLIKSNRLLKDMKAKLNEIYLAMKEIEFENNKLLKTKDALINERLMIDEKKFKNIKKMIEKSNSNKLRDIRRDMCYRFHMDKN